MVSIRERNGPATVEEVRTGRRASLASLAAAVEQIERWLREAAAQDEREDSVSGTREGGRP